MMRRPKKEKNKYTTRIIDAEFVNQAYKVFLGRSPSEDELSIRIASGIAEIELFYELWNSEELRFLTEESNKAIKEREITKADIENAYCIILKRNPSEQELNERISSGISSYDLLKELWDSEEFKGLTQSTKEIPTDLRDIERLYCVILNRNPSEQELNERIGSGISKEQLFGELWDSEEFKETAQNRIERVPINSNEIDEIYRATLERSPSEHELNERIASSISKIDLLEEILESDECKALLKNQQHEKDKINKDNIIIAYKVFLNRIPSDTELRERVASGISELELLTQLWNSKELKESLVNITEDPPADIGEIKKSYEIFFRRIPSDQELAERINSGITIGKLLEELLNSDELSHKMHKISLNSSSDLERTDIDQNLKDMLKKTLKKKWEIIDSIYQKQPVSDLVCNLCGYKGLKSNYEILTSECAFGGGYLERYKCPECGCIFGPLKMLDLTEEELEDEYNIHYSLFNEGDCTDKELLTFNSLQPDKNKRYLNFGCGIWADTIDILRDKGYDVWGYEPFATEVVNSHVINDLNTLKNMKFDGIFSNDLLEHINNPNEYFRLFSDLLKDNESKMAHSTGCYKYLYETTRFHLYFYTGKSVEMLCNNTGFKIESYNEDVAIEYFNYVYKREER